MLKWQTQIAIKLLLSIVYDQPFHILRSGKTAPTLTPEIGSFGTFLLKKNDVVRYAVVNGFVYDMENFKVFDGNGLIE